jgi:uncharacterized membrane protein
VEVFPAGAGASEAVGPEGAGEMKAHDFIGRLKHEEIVAAIRAAEKETSGEIRVFVSRKKVTDPVVAAQAHFFELGMEKTREHNGVLLFVAPRTHKFAVIGDAGVHSKCGDEFWSALATEMSGYFRRSEFTSGLVHGVRKAGELLAKHFPRRPDDTNELPDEVVHD